MFSCRQNCERESRIKPVGEVGMSLIKGSELLKCVIHGGQCCFKHFAPLVPLLKFLLIKGFNKGGSTHLFTSIALGC